MALQTIRRKTNNIISIEFYNMFVPSMTLKPIRKTTATHNVLHCVLQHVCAQHDPSQPHKKLHTAMFSSVFCNMSVPSMTLQTIRNNFKTYHFAFCLTEFLRPVWPLAPSEITNNLYSQLCFTASPCPAWPFKPREETAIIRPGAVLLLLITPRLRRSLNK